MIEIPMRCNQQKRLKTVSLLYKTNPRSPIHCYCFAYDLGHDNCLLSNKDAVVDILHKQKASIKDKQMFAFFALSQLS